MSRNTEVEFRDWYITQTPKSPETDLQCARVRAINALQAIDAYSIVMGYGTYSALIEEGKEEIGVGTDEHGLWATFENTTIWAIPVDSVTETTEDEINQFVGDLLSHDNDVISELVQAPDRVVDAARKKFTVATTGFENRNGRPVSDEIKQIEYDGLYVSVKRHPKTSQLMVIITPSDAIAHYDIDERGIVLMEVIADGGTIYEVDEVDR